MMFVYPIVGIVHEVFQSRFMSLRAYCSPSIYCFLTFYPLRFLVLQEQSSLYGRESTTSTPKLKAFR